MRALVQAIREVAEVEEAEVEEMEKGRAQLTDTTALAGLLQQAVNELRPVAEAKNVRLMLTLELELEKTGAETKLAGKGKTTGAGRPDLPAARLDSEYGRAGNSVAKLRLYRGQARRGFGSSGRRKVQDRRSPGRNWIVDCTSPAGASGGRVGASGSGQ